MGGAFSANHRRFGQPTERDCALGHPMALAEIACGTPPAPRRQTLGDMSLLWQAHLASWTEVMTFIEREKLHSLGRGFVDIALLASACITPDAALWTLDKKLVDLTRRFQVQFAPSLYLVVMKAVRQTQS